MGGPNYSCNIRRMVYFRVKYKCGRAPSSIISPRSLDSHTSCPPPRNPRASYAATSTLAPLISSPTSMCESALSGTSPINGNAIDIGTVPNDDDTISQSQGCGVVEGSVGPPPSASELAEHPPSLQTQRSLSDGFRPLFASWDCLEAAHKVDMWADIPLVKAWLQHQSSCW